MKKKEFYIKQKKRRIFFCKLVAAIIFYGLLAAVIWGMFIVASNGYIPSCP